MTAAEATSGAAGGLPLWRFTTVCGALPQGADPQSISSEPKSARNRSAELGLALALTLALSLSAAAEQAKGTIYSINPADHSIVLDDGTRLWVSEGQFADLTLGDQVQAAYQMQGEKKMVIEMARPGLDGSFDPLSSVQNGD